MMQISRHYNHYTADWALCVQDMDQHPPAVIGIHTDTVLDYIPYTRPDMIMMASKTHVLVWPTGCTKGTMMNVLPYGRTDTPV